MRTFVDMSKSFKVIKVTIVKLIFDDFKGPLDDLLVEGDTCSERRMRRRRRRRKHEEQSWEEHLQENWENCLVSQQAWFSFQEMMTVELPVPPQELNLSYQDLGDAFQWESFLQILRRLIRVEKLQLVSDALSDLSSVRLPRWKPHYPECTAATV